MNPPDLVPTKFTAQDTAGIAAQLADQGYVVIRGIYDPTEVAELQAMCLDELSYIADAETPYTDLWSLRPDTHYPEPKMRGLMGEFGLSQGPMAWRVRCNRVIRQIFGNILGVTDPQRDLVCSMDAVAFSPDCIPVGNVNWLHVDQNPKVEAPQIGSYQGIMYLSDTVPGGVTTALVPGSHKEWLRHDFTSPNHFQIVSEDYGPRAVRLVMAAGDLLIFASKTVHQGYWGPHRLAVMVSYGRKEDRTEDVRKDKIMMYLGGFRSTHWSMAAQVHGYKFFSTAGREFQPLRPTLRADLSEEDLMDANSLLYEPELCEYYPGHEDLIPSDILELL